MGKWAKRSRAAARRMSRKRRPTRRSRRARTSGLPALRRKLKALIPLSYQDITSTTDYNLSDGWDWAAANAAVCPLTNLITAGTTSFATFNQQNTVKGNRFYVNSLDIRFHTKLTLGVGTPVVQLPLKFKLLVLGTHTPTNGVSSPFLSSTGLDYIYTFLRYATDVSYNSPFALSNQWKVLGVYERELHRDTSVNGGAGSPMISHHSFRVNFRTPWRVELVENTQAAVTAAEIASGQIWCIGIIDSPTDPVNPTTRQMRDFNFRIGFRNQS